MRGRPVGLVILVAAVTPAFAADVPLSLHVFDATVCKPEDKWAELPVAYVTLSVIARDDIACWFRYRVEINGTFEVRMCYVGAGPVVVSTAGPDRGDCFTERSGFVIDASDRSWPPLVEQGGEIRNGKREGVWTGILDQEFPLPMYTVTYQAGRRNGEYRNLDEREHGA